jgi:hypothetical protein
MSLSKFKWRLGKVKRKIQGRLPIFDPGDWRKTVYLAGSARSGTTWVGDIMNYDNHYRLIFEPFDPRNVDVTSHFNYNQYLRPDNRDKKFLEPAKQILSGQLKNKEIDGLNRKTIVKERLIKDIRTNFLLKWIKTNFPEIPIIFLLRHPCAVAYSRMKSEWDTRFEVVFDQPELMEDFINPFIGELNNAQTEFEKHIFFWCIQNYVPLKQFKVGQIQVVFYENFCVTPEAEIKNIFSFLNREYDPTILGMVKKPSTTSRKSSAILDGKDLTRSYQEKCTSEQLERTIEILKLFGLDKIYGQDVMPLVSGNDAFID